MVLQVLLSNSILNATGIVINLIYTNIFRDLNHMVHPNSFEKFEY